MSFRPWSDKTLVLDLVSPEEFIGKKAEKVIDMGQHKNLYYQLSKTAYYNKVDSISAPQVGINLRVIVYRAMDGRWRSMFNPSVVQWTGEAALRYEKCCSYPGEHRKKSRINRLVIQFWDESGKVRVTTFTNIEASLILHEMDHLDGVDWNSMIEADKEA